MLCQLIRNAQRCIYTRYDDFAPKPPPCKLFCSVRDAQGWLLKPWACKLILSFPCCRFASCTFTHVYTQTHTECVSIHTPLGFFFLFGFLSRYCFKLVPGLTASLNFICLSSPPPPLPPSSLCPPSPEVILFTFSAAFSMSLYALQGI